MKLIMFMLWVFNIFLLINIVFVNSLDQASFYGDSFISLPFQEAKSSTDIHFKFKTLLPNALLLLVAGTTDYCIVRLENSKIKISINLGAGESELLSSNHLKLNDLKWHEIFISRNEANLTMIIDQIHKYQKRLPGRFFELNIHYGLFVGGHGNFTEIFFGHLDKFRGCLSELSYNGIMVIEQARHRQQQSLVKDITWNCATEFDASIDRPISFIEDDAFFLINHNINNRDIKIKFEFKSIVQQGMLLYNSGQTVKFDFFLIEIWKGMAKFLLKIGNRTIELINNELINDGQWHKLSLHLTNNFIELNVDNKIKSEKNIFGQLFNLNDNFFIGGIEITKRFRAMSKGCKYCDTSFKGCIKHLLINDKMKGFPDILISNGILPSCLWHFPCLQKPCETNAVCIQHGLDSFHCQCLNEKFCIKSNYTKSYKIFSRNSLATELELLSVEPLNVLEGQSSIITTNNLHMILDYQKYGIKNTGIHFYIVEPPAHGSITIDIWPHEKNSFTLYDIARDKIHYIHDGSEYHQDSFILDLEFSPADTFILPVYLQGKFRFSLTVTILPVNDPPQLKIPDTSVLRIVQGSKKLIKSDLFKVIDSDNSADQLVYNILQSDIGHFENEKNPGKKITSFTQQDIENDNIIFIQNNININDSYISLQISDGIGLSPVSRIRVSISPQYWRLENNTGLIVLHQTSSLITSYNLSFSSNVVNNDNKLQYQIVKKPHYGVIEIEKNINNWDATDSFTNTDMKQHRIRYRHVSGTPDFDEFQFRLIFDKSALYTFRLTFAKCNLFILNKNTIKLNGTWETTIDSNYLLFQTNPIKILTTSIHFVIIEPPKYGYLFSSLSKYKMKSCDMFTQEDILSNNIKYKLFQKTYSLINDNLSFIVLSPGCNNITGNLSIIYHPTNDLKNQINITLKPLKVDEGGKVLIDENHFNIDLKKSIDLIFNITESPQFGIIQIKQSNNGDLIIRNNTNFFTLKELKLNQIYYIHDDSESTEDHLKFLCLSIDTDHNEDEFQYVDSINFKISLKNDNSPYRIVDKIFNVVVGGERLLTGNDLKYADLDLNTNATDIIYTCRDLLNGNFYFINNQSTKINGFNQDDLDNNKVIFKHKGPEYGKVRLWITDGHFHVNGILEIQASAPFIHILTNKKLIVEQNNYAIINEQHLSYSTNVYATNSDVVYEIVTKPTFGKIVITGTLNKLKYFNHANLSMGNISYINELTNSNADEISLRVKCKDAVNVAQLTILILPSNYWEPIHIKTKKKLFVEEATSVIITKHIIEAIQPNVPPSAINYFINEPPDNGYITILTDNKNNGDYYEPLNVLCFNQDLINDNRVLYIQSVANQTNDQILFNITNGIVWYNNFLLNIEIIPERLYISSNNLRINENGNGILSTNHLIILTDYYKTKIKDYVIVQEPKFGCIQLHKRCLKTNSFTQKELLAGVIRYVHDGSENLYDEIKIVAVAGQKRSVPVTLKIDIVPINDQLPKLINNTGLIMWEGGAEILTNTMLAATDADLPKDVLKYQIINCWWGNLSLKNDLTKSINNFTQDLIDREMVVFNHYNGTEAKFSFNITDGLHTTKDNTFLIKTIPVKLKLTSKSLHIFPLQKKYLTSSHLLSIISDPNRTINYKIIKPPSLGRLMMESESPGIFKIVSKFTQENLNNSQIFYEHTHQFSDLYANDSFIFDVEARLAEPLKNRILKIDISVSSGGLDAYVSIPKIVVNEGGMTNLLLNLSGVVTFLENHAGLHVPIIHALANQPQHGQIFLKNNHSITTFTQQQLENGQVYYEHDHSDSLGDNIHLSFYLIPGFISLCNITVPIIVNPINDQPFSLVTPAPNLIVVQGENHTITRNELATEDADTPPSKLKYDLISGPNHGKLILLPDTKIPIQYFTQSDIDNNLLIYIHNSSILKDSFHFRVWDEKFRPQFFLFNIIVIPIEFKIIADLPIYLQQGSDVVFLTEKQFFIETNANKNKINYSIIKEPKHGTLYVRDKPSLTFTHIDLLNENVMYLQTDMTTANDTFKLFGEILSSGNTSIGNEINVIVKVQPLMQIKNFTVLSGGEYNRLTLNVLDATPLAKLTNSNPKYTIISQSKFFQIRKVIRSSGEKRNVLDTIVNNFYHEEIQSGLIYFVIKDNLIVGTQERIQFLLAASIFQPAIGELRIIIKSGINNDIFSTLAGPSDPASHEGGLHFSNPNMAKDYFLIVSMVAGVVVLGIIVIVIIKCRAMNNNDNNINNKEDHSLQTMPLPRPPDRLMSSSPLPPPSSSSIKQQNDYNNSSPINTALPHCKVTPLNRNDTIIESHYPYGVDEHPDDWSSCEASDPSCPSKNIMLRRNQYWV